MKTFLLLVLLTIIAMSFVDTTSRHIEVESEVSVPATPVPHPFHAWRTTGSRNPLGNEQSRSDDFMQYRRNPWPVQPGKTMLDR